MRIFEFITKISDFLSKLFYRLKLDIYGCLFEYWVDSLNCNSDG